mmetsp:Transcript_30658/g.39594  ORF Transcript_30658/g.39594 Transcript_30658/m.39594 type:complete len:261 (+) Transcript_30658:86-868(+)
MSSPTSTNKQTPDTPSASPTAALTSSPNAFARSPSVCSQDSRSITGGGGGGAASITTTGSGSLTGSPSPLSSPRDLQQPQLLTSHPPQPQPAPSALAISAAKSAALAAVNITSSSSSSVGGGGGGNKVLPPPWPETTSSSPPTTTTTAAAAAAAAEAFSSDVSAPPLVSAQWIRLPSFFVALFSFRSEVLGIVNVCLGFGAATAGVPFPLLFSTFFRRLDKDDARGASTLTFFAGGGADLSSTVCRFTGTLLVPFVDLLF